MTNDQLLIMPKKEILEGAKAAYTNANTLFNDSGMIAKSGSYGTANSLLILSVEECVKSMILTAGFLGTKLDFDIHPFFSNHKIKHAEAAKIQPFINAFSSFAVVMLDIAKKRKSKAQILVNVGLSLAFGYDRNEEDPDKFKKWWDNQNESKNNGLYVGYRNSKWSVPQQISEKIYNETRSIAYPFIEGLELIMELHENDYKYLFWIKGIVAPENSDIHDSQK